MDEAVLLKKLVRQLKWLNFWVAFFGILFLASLAVTGVLIYHLATYVHQSEQSLTNLQQKTLPTLSSPPALCSNPSLKALAGTYCK